MARRQSSHGAQGVAGDGGLRNVARGVLVAMPAYYAFYFGRSTFLLVRDGSSEYGGAMVAALALACVSCLLMLLIGLDASLLPGRIKALGDREPFYVAIALTGGAAVYVGSLEGTNGAKIIAGGLIPAALGLVVLLITGWSYARRAAQAAAAAERRPAAPKSGRAGQAAKGARDRPATQSTHAPRAGRKRRKKSKT